MKNTLFVGKVRLDFDELESTNDYLTALSAKSNPPEGTIIIAAKQSKGKGQVGSSWFTGEGENIAMSLLFHPKFVHPSLQFLLSQTFALGVLDALRTFCPTDISIKWPNDLYYKNKKIGGMLIENGLQGNRFSQSVWGLGLNVNQKAFPSHLPNAISLYQILGTEIHLEIIIEQLCLSIEQRYLQLRQGRQGQIESDYLTCFYKRNTNCTFQDAKTRDTFIALPLGVNEAGHLRVEKENGTQQTFGLKELLWIID